MDQLGDLLVVYTLFAGIVEGSLTGLFTSKFYQTYLEGKGVKFPIVLVLSQLVAFAVGMNVVVELGATTVHGLSWVGTVLSGFILSGGSAQLNSWRGSKKGKK